MEPTGSTAINKIMATKKIPKQGAPIQLADKKIKPRKPLVRSKAAGEREIAGLRRGQAARDAAPANGEDDVRASLI